MDANLTVKDSSAADQVRQRRPPTIALWITAASLTLLFPASDRLHADPPPRKPPSVVTFDDLPPGTRVVSQYRGVTVPDDGIVRSAADKKLVGWSFPNPGQKGCTGIEFDSALAKFAWPTASKTPPPWWTPVGDASGRPQPEERRPWHRHRPGLLATLATDGLRREYGRWGWNQGERPGSEQRRWRLGARQLDDGFCDLAQVLAVANNVRGDGQARPGCAPVPRNGDVDRRLS